MLVMVTKLKGGAGATTICREIATYAVQQGKNVALIDLDGQGTLTNWWNRRDKNIPGPALLQLDILDIPAKAEAMRAKYDLVLIDTPPSVHHELGKLAGIADQIIIPTRPTPDDLDTIGAVLRLVSGHSVSFVLSAVSSKRSIDAAQAEKLLSERGQVLGRTTNKTAFYRAAYDGLTANETDRTTAPEIKQIYNNLVTEATHDTAPKKQSGSKNGRTGSRGGKNRTGSKTPKVSRRTVKK